MCITIYLVSIIIAQSEVKPDSYYVYVILESVTCGIDTQINSGDLNLHTAKLNY